MFHQKWATKSGDREISTNPDQRLQKDKSSLILTTQALREFVLS